MNAIATIDEVRWCVTRDGGAAWNSSRHGAGWGTTKDGRGGEAEWAQAKATSRPWQADGAVEATAVDGRSSGSGCDKREWGNILQKLVRP